MKKIVTLLCALLTSTAFAGAPAQTKTEQQLITDQRAAVETLLDANGKTVVVAVNGLCCATCGIGVKKKLQKLDFVAKKGVLLDIENSMAVVTLKDANVVDQAAIVKAVRKAGYEPVRFYQFNGQDAKETAITAEG